MNLTPKQKRELRGLLLECGTMQHRDLRDAVVADLPKQMRANIKRNDADHFDVANILDTCLRFIDGLDELIESLHFFEGNSIAMETVLQFQTELANQPPPPPPLNPVPVVALPTSTSQPISIPDKHDSTIVSISIPKGVPIRASTIIRRVKKAAAISIIESTPKLPLIVNEQMWPKDGKVMVYVAAGEFLYGEDKVKIHLPEFWIDKTPITNAEYARFVTETNYKPPRHWEGKIPPSKIETHPVVRVTWADAEAYAQWAGKQLPTEQQWEKAARGTDGQIYPWGNHEPTVKLGNFNQSVGHTTPVGQYSPQGDSPYGCVDMSGNVWEWTASVSQADDGRGNIVKKEASHIVRGGSWYYGSDYLRCSSHYLYRPIINNDLIGFRVISTSIDNLAPAIAQPSKAAPIQIIDISSPTPPPTANEQVWPKDGKVMIRVPAGEFFYGEDKVKVHLPEFWIDKTPVTNGEYARFVAETGHEPPKHWQGKTPPSKIETHPVVRVSWHQAEAYAQWAGKQLLTEQQWEKAARGIDGRLFPWGDNEPTAELGNFKQKVSNTTPVGRYSPQGDSFYGCVDMAGNVWEWTASLYQADKELRVLRGGSGSSETDYLRCAYRYFNFPNNRSFDIGFRCFCNPS